MTPHRILTAVLALSVIILFYLHFSKPVSDSVSIPGTAVPANTSIVYVNSDSLLENFSFYKNKKVEFENRERQIKIQLQNESENLQKDAAEYQERAAMMTENERAMKEGELMERQELLMKKKDDLLDAFEQEQSKFSEELYSKLSSYLKEYNKDKNYTFILGYQKGGGILFANDSLDITSQVLEGINKGPEEE